MTPCDHFQVQRVLLQKAFETLILPVASFLTTTMLLCALYQFLNIHTGSPHIRLEQTNFIGRVLCRLLRARNARSVSARSGNRNYEIARSLLGDLI